MVLSFCEQSKYISKICQKIEICQWSRALLKQAITHLMSVLVQNDSLWIGFQTVVVIQSLLTVKSVLMMDILNVDEFWDNFFEKKIMSFLKLSAKRLNDLNR